MAPYLGFRGTALTAWLTFACAVDMALFGYDQGVFSGVVVTDDFLKLHDLVGPSKTTILSTVSAIYTVGCFLGALVAFGIGEKTGRKKAIIIGSIIMSIGTVIMATSFSLPQMFVGRTILGIGNGINTSTAPVWQTETSTAAARGKLVILELTMTIFGVALANWINYGLSFHGGSLAWRFPLAFQFVFIFALFATVPWLPESPRWLLAHGRKEEAAEVFAALQDKPIDDPAVTTVLAEVTYSVEYERQHAIRWRDLLSGKVSENGDTKSLRRLILGAGTQAMQQFTGINIISYYFPTVMIESVGLSNQMARLLSGCNSLSYLVFAFLAVFIVDRLGRRGLMLLSVCLQFLSFLVITILLSMADDSERGRALAKASIFFFFLYYGSFGAGMLGVPWLYPTEINSLPMRTKGAAVATATNWITNFVIVEVTPPGIQNLGWKFYIVWTVFNFCFVPIIYYFYPETSNRTLEDIDAYYRGNPSLIVTNDKEIISVKRPQEYVNRDPVQMLQQDGVSVLDDKSAMASKE